MKKLQLTSYLMNTVKYFPSVIAKDIKMSNFTPLFNIILKILPKLYNKQRKYKIQKEEVKLSVLTKNMIA